MSESKVFIIFSRVVSYLCIVLCVFLIIFFGVQTYKLYKTDKKLKEIEIQMENNKQQLKQFEKENQEALQETTNNVIMEVEFNNGNRTIKQN